MTGIPLKSPTHQYTTKSPSQQMICTELLFNHEKELDFKQLSWELLTRQHSGDALFFSALFMNETERHQLLRAFCR